MRAQFTKQALENYASMVEKYGDIYVNELGQVCRSKQSHETKYQDEARKVPARSCMYAHLNRTNFPRTVEALEKMFVEQTIERAGQKRADDAAKAVGKKTPDVVTSDGGAFERLTKTADAAPAAGGKKVRAVKTADAAPAGVEPDHTNGVAPAGDAEEGE